MQSWLSHAAARDIHPRAEPDIEVYQANISVAAHSGIDP